MMKLLYSNQEDQAREEFVRWLQRRRSCLENRKLNAGRVGCGRASIEDVDAEKVAAGNRSLVA